MITVKDCAAKLDLVARGKLGCDLSRRHRSIGVAQRIQDGSAALARGINVGFLYRSGNDMGIF